MKARMEQKSDLKWSYIIPAEVAKCQISTFSNDYRLLNGVKEKSGVFFWFHKETSDQSYLKQNIKQM